MSLTEGLVVQAPGYSVARFREATDVASVCKEIVLKTAVKIGDRNYVRVEGWTSIAVAHGCIASVVPGTVVEVMRGDKVIGIKAVTELKRQHDGAVLANAEGYVGDDEIDWYGSHGEKIKKWNKVQKREVEVVVPKRADFAIRSMAQTRGISKVCRNAFSHVVVLMNANLSTTPYEEVVDPNEEVGDRSEGKPTEPAQDAPGRAEEKAPAPTGANPPAEEKKKEISVPRDESVALEQQFREGKWEKVKIHFGKNKGTTLGQLERAQLLWYCFTWGGPSGKPNQDDLILRAACNVAIDENKLEEPTRR